jgi:hypothetical protein
MKFYTTSMAKKNQLSEEVEKTLQSFDNDIILENNPFLLTRLKAEREKRLHERKKGFALRISLNRVLMLLILLINIITLVYNYDKNTKQNLQKTLVLELKEDFQIDQTEYNF